MHLLEHVPLSVYSDFKRFATPLWFLIVKTLRVIFCAFSILRIIRERLKQLKPFRVNQAPRPALFVHQKG